MKSPASNLADRPTRRWRPLVTGDDAVRLRSAVDRIATDIATPLPASRLPSDQRPHTASPVLRDASLGGGGAGTAVFHAYRTACLGDAASAAAADRHLDEALRILATVPSFPGLYGGFTGVAWACDYCRDPSRSFAAVAPAADDVTDALLMNWLRSQSVTATYDLISGWVGTGTYFLDRLPQPTAPAGLAAVITLLAAAAERVDQGLVWRSPSVTLPASLRATGTTGAINLGLAHGMPGVIALAAAAYEAGVAAEVAGELLQGAVTWLLSRRLPSDSPSGFAAWVVPDRPDRPASRHAWCYGDPGVALALWRAAVALDDPAWKRAALSIALNSVAQAPVVDGVRDASLCHGAAGLAHLYNRLFQATGEPTLAEASRSWFARACGMLLPDHGIGGVTAAIYDDNGEHRVADPGFLLGAAGVGLAFLAAISDVEPIWDRVMLADLCPIA